jgi:hypothetical protein
MLCDLTMLLTFTTTTTTTTAGTNLLLGYTTLYHSTGNMYDSLRQIQMTEVIQQSISPPRAGYSPDFRDVPLPNDADVSAGVVVASSAGGGANRTTATTTNNNNNNNQDHNGGSGDEEEEEEDSKPHAVGTPVRTSNNNNNHNGGSGDDDDEEEEEEEDSKPRAFGTHLTRTRAQARRRARPESQRQASSPVARRQAAKKAKRDEVKLAARIAVVAERDARGEHATKAMRKQVNEAAAADRGVAAAAGGATRNAAAAAAAGGGGGGGELGPVSREIAGQASSPVARRQASSPVARRGAAKKAKLDELKLAARIIVVAERDARGEHVSKAMRKQVNEAAAAGGGGGVLAPRSREIARGFWCVKPTQDKKTGETIPWLDKITGKPKPCGKGKQHKKYCHLHLDQIKNPHFAFES